MVRIVKNPSERRAEIITTARAFFQTREYNKTTIQDVMNELDIAKGTVYYYFKSKEELFEAVIENMVDENTSHMENLLKISTGTALEKIQILISAGNLAEDNNKIFDNLHQSINREMHLRLMAKALVKQGPLYAAVIRQGNEEGIFHVETPLECAEFILTAIQFLTDQGIYPWTQEQLIRRLLAFPRLLETQLNAPQGSFQFFLSK